MNDSNRKQKRNWRIGSNVVLLSGGIAGVILVLLAIPTGESWFILIGVAVVLGAIVLSWGIPD